DVVGEILLIAGDDSHKIKYGDVGTALAAARGLTGGLPKGRPGDPDNDDDWFVTEWMDTTRAQEALQFQHHSWDAMLAEMRANAGWERLIMAVLRPPHRSVTHAPGRLLEAAGPVRRPVGRDPPQVG